MATLLGFLAGATSFGLLGLLPFGSDREPLADPDELGLKRGVGMGDRKPPEQRVRQRRKRLEPAKYQLALLDDLTGDA